MRKFQKTIRVATSVAVFFWTIVPPAYSEPALPTGGNVVHGSALIGGPSGGKLGIDQSSENAIIHWDGFSIGSGGGVHFDNGSGATLNRVTGFSGSQIDGSLTATGSLFLINRNGVIIGRNGVVQTGGSFVASTLDIENGDFLDGGSYTFRGGASGKVINLGKISSLGGDVALFSHQVLNEGTINAPLGTVGLAAGREILIRDASLDEGKFLVKLGDVASAVSEAGTINAAMVELRANGGNVYALAGNRGGSINATGVAKRGGRIFLTAGKKGRVRVAKKVRVKRRIKRKPSNITLAPGDWSYAGGEAYVYGGLVSLGSLLDASGDGGAGGKVTITGTDVALSSEARINASGKTGGGSIRIGGDLQGSGDLPLADRVTLSEGSVIEANALETGDGGKVVVWSETDTLTAGRVEARGAAGGLGGFVELSSRGKLAFAGTVDTGGGTLLLDPEDIEIGTVSTEATASLITPGALIAALATNNVVLTTSGAGTDNGDIFITSAVNYSSVNNLSLLAHRHIIARASVQNAQATGGGDINLVAGWDGSSGLTGTLATGLQTDLTFNAAAFDAVDVDAAAASLFGVGSGSVSIGDGTQTSGVAVGSRSGATRAYGHNLNILAGAGSGADGRYAQLGFQASNQGEDYDITGALSARVRNDIVAAGGSNRHYYAQLGHVGADQANDAAIEASVTNSATISIAAGNNLTFSGGGAFQAYSQLGHGGVRADGNYSGAIMIMTANDLTFSGGGASHAYSQLGHGGFSADGNHSGAITITRANDLSFSGGSEVPAYSQLGHGGYDADGSHRGDIMIMTANDLTFSGGGASQAYSQLGHGGFSADGNHSGSITITTARDLTFTAAGGSDAYSQLGHGGRSANGDHSGDIMIVTANDLTFSGDSERAYSQLGHGGRSADGDHSGDIKIMTANDLTFSGGASLAYSQLGHGGYFADGDHSGVITITTANDLTFSAGGGTGAYSQLGHGGASSDGDHSGDIKIMTANDLTFSAGGGTGAYSQLGHGGFADGNHSGAITITTANDLSFSGGLGFGAYSQLGHGSADFGNTTSQATGTRQGHISVTATGEISLIDGTAPTTNFNYGWIGHGSRTANAYSNANVTIKAAAIDSAAAAVAAGGIGVVRGDFITSNLRGGNVLVQVTASTLTTTAASLFITINTPNDLTLMASHNLVLNNAIQNSAAAGGGDINLVAGWDGTTAFTAAAFDAVDVDAAASLFGNNSGSVSIGDGTQTSGVAVGSRSGATRAYGHNLNILAGTGSGADGRYAQLGFQASNQGVGYDITGALSARVRNDIVAAAVSNRHNYAQLGHVGADQASGAAIEASVTNSATISIAAGNNLTFSGGGAFQAYSQLGHGGVGADGNYSGAIMIMTANDLTFSGGASQAYSQLGHGGYSADGSHSGAITITRANDLSFRGGSVGTTYSQLGHGGFSADGNHSGSITITTARDLTFTAAGGSDAYSQLGHGGRIADGDHSGDIMIVTANDLTFSGGSASQAYSQLGHGGRGADGDHSGDIKIMTANDLTFSGGSASLAYSQLGHGGYFADGDHSGVITITTANDLTFSAGGGTGAYSQLGHGGFFADGNHSGAITITTANDLSFSGGASQAYSQLGHGGFFADGNHSGAITITTANDLSFSGSLGFGAYSQLGHGSADFGNATQTTGTRQGHISVTATGEISLIDGTAPTTNLNYGWIGHGSRTANAYSNANVTIRAAAIDRAAAAVAAGGIGVVRGDFITSNLRGGNVLVQVTDSTLTTTAASLFTTINTPNDLTLMASHNLVLNNAIQNSAAAGGGDINLVAGWDGTTAFTAAAFDAVDVDAAASLFGNNSGSVSIGDGTQTSGVAVGSRSGATRAYGHNLNILAGTGADGRYAQLGFQASDQGRTYDITGALSARVRNDIVAAAGAANQHNYAQLGHVGADQTTDATIDGSVTNSATISIAAGNDLTFSAGGSRAYSQLGHGGYLAYSSHSGAITIITANNLTFSGSSASQAYSQLGHGGAFAIGSHSGSITITKANNLSFSGSSGGQAYSQLGHGGYSAGGTHSGAITITRANDLSFSAGSGASTYSQLGHGGVGADGTHSGAIMIMTANNLTFSGGGRLSAHSQLGHGGYSAIGTFSGSITITTANNLSFGGDVGYSQLGHGGTFSDGNHSGDIMIMAANDLTFSGGGGRLASSQLGHGGAFSDGNHSGDITVMTANNLSFSGGSGNQAYSQLGHGSADFGNTTQTTGTRQGHISVTATGEISLIDGTAPTTNFNYGWIGHGSRTANAYSNANVTISAARLDNAAAALASGAQGTVAADWLLNNLKGGAVSLSVTDAGVNLNAPTSILGTVSSAHQFLVNVANDLVFNTGFAFTQGGAGNLIFAAGNNFHNDSGSLTPLTTGGRWLIYSTRPDQNRQDIEITDREFLVYNQTFNSGAPIPGSFPTGDGLIYSVAPVVAITQSATTITYGDTLSFTPTYTGTVGGAAINLAAFGLTSSVLASAFKHSLATGVAKSSSGNANAGTHSNAFASATNTTSTSIRGLGLSLVNATLTVNKAALTITANDASLTAGGSPYSGGAGVTGSGFAAGEGLSDLTGTLVYGGTSQGATDAGTYLITPSGYNAANYAITFASGQLTISAPGAEESVLELVQASLLTGPLCGDSEIESPKSCLDYSSFSQGEGE